MFPHGAHNAQLGHQVLFDVDCREGVLRIGRLVDESEIQDDLAGLAPNLKAHMIAWSLVKQGPSKFRNASEALPVKVSKDISRLQRRLLGGTPGSNACDDDARILW